MTTTAEEKRRQYVFEYLQRKHIPFTNDEIDIPPFKNEISFGKILSNKEEDDLEEFVKKTAALYEWVNW